MHLCYIDESGTPEIPGNSTHFILSGLSIPIKFWKSCDSDVEKVKKRFGLEHSEIHAGWIKRIYPEQKKIPNFGTLTYVNRISAVEKIRKEELFRLQKSRIHGAYQQTKKTYRQTAPYIHLTYDERIFFLTQVAQLIGSWGFVRLFAECIDKVFFDPKIAGQSISEQAFEQIISRFEHYLEKIKSPTEKNNYGLLIHDNNETVAKKHTLLMKAFHDKGTLWTKINNIIETPLFVNSELTSMVQVADLCAFTLRRYLENKEEDLFEHIFKRVDTVGGFTVGIRHFTASGCKCKICAMHKV
jgi:hypothetical protein